MPHGMKSKDLKPLKTLAKARVFFFAHIQKDLLIIHEEVLFFVLGVRHYGALEEDAVARITPCRALRKMHQFT